jgi:hypothetical protein
MFSILFILIITVNANIIRERPCHSPSTTNRDECIDKMSHIAFNRIGKKSDIHKHLTLRIYAQNSETSLLTTMLMFYSNNNRYHNALMLSSSQMQKYSKITHNSRLKYNNEITIITKAIRVIFPYAVINVYDRLAIYNPNENNYIKDAYSTYLPLSTLSDDGNNVDVSNINSGSGNNGVTSSVSMPSWDPFLYYDAILSLDRYSSIWDHYNILTIEKDEVSLRFNIDALLSESVEDLDKIVKLQCVDPTSNDIKERKVHAKACFVNNTYLPRNITLFSSKNNISHKQQQVITDGLFINDRFYANYKLVIDLTLRVNSLPIDLFLTWKSNKKTDIVITLQQDDNTTSQLSLTSKFVFEMNDNDVVVLGVDFLYYFSKVEYSVDTNKYHVWTHDHLYYTNKYEWIQIIIIFIAIVELICLFCWIMDINYIVFYQFLNYDILRNLRLKGQVYFSYIQIQHEIVSILMASILWILGSIFIVDHKQSQPSMFNFNHSSHRQIFGLFLLLSIPHVILLILIIGSTSKMNNKLYRYYRSRYDYYFNIEYSPLPIIIGPIQPHKQEKIRPPLKIFTSNSKTNSLGHFLLSDNENNNEKEKATKKMKKHTTNEYKEDRQKRREREDEEANEQERLFAEKYHTKVVESPFPLVLVRNLAFVVVIFSSLICILIFDNNNIFRLYLVVIAYILTFFMAYYISLLLHYILLSKLRVKYYALYVIFLILEVILFIVFIFWSITSIHLSYFQNINSIYSEVDVYAFVIIMSSMIILFAVFMVTAEIDKHLKVRLFIS